jgi:hypothetical protein
MKLPNGENAVVDVAKLKTTASIQIILKGSTKLASSKPSWVSEKMTPKDCVR